MKIDKSLLDDLTQKAKASTEDESGYAHLCGGPKPADAERLGARDGPYEPIGEEDILTL